jgi:hypothetical protein
MLKHVSAVLSGSRLYARHCGRRLHKGVAAHLLVNNRYVLLPLLLLSALSRSFFVDSSDPRLTPTGTVGRVGSYFDCRILTQQLVC